MVVALRVSDWERVVWKVAPGTAAPGPDMDPNRCNPRIHWPSVRVPRRSAALLCARFRSTEGPCRSDFPNDLTLTPPLQATPPRDRPPRGTPRRVPSLPPQRWALRGGPAVARGPSQGSAAVGRPLRAPGLSRPGPLRRDVRLRESDDEGASRPRPGVAPVQRQVRPHRHRLAVAVQREQPHPLEDGAPRMVDVGSASSEKQSTKSRSFVCLIPALTLLGWRGNGA